MNNQRIRNKYLYVIIVSFLLFYVLPYSFLPFIGGADFKFHFNRIYSISENIRHGKAFFPIYQTTLFNYGYASPLFYGDLLLYPLSLLILLDIPYDVVSVLSLFFGVFLTIITAYYTGTKIFKTRSSSFVLTFLYVFSSYMALNNTYRFALGESYAAIFLPLIMLGYWSIVYDDKKLWYWLPLALSGMIYCHVLSTLLTVILLFILAVFSFKRIIKDKERIKLIFLSIALFFSLSAAFILPLIEQMLSTRFLSTTGQSSIIFGTLAQRTLPTKFVFSDFTMILGKENAYSYWIPNGIGLFPIITLLYAVLIKKTKDIKFYTLYFIGTLFLFAVTRRFPWDLLQNVFGILQFPWRLLIYATFFFALSAAYLINIEDAFSKRIIQKSYIIVLCVISAFSFFMSGVLTYRSMYDSYKESRKYDYDFYSRIGSGEYLPAYQDENGNYMDYQSLTDVLYARSETVTSNHLEESNMSFIRDYSDIYVEYKNNHNKDTYIEVPLLMYKGYKAFDLDTNKELPVTYGEYNVVRVYLNSIKGSFVVKYVRTPVQMVSMTISVVSLSFLILFCFKKHHSITYTKNKS